MSALLITKHDTLDETGIKYPPSQQKTHQNTHANKPKIHVNDKVAYIYRCGDNYTLRESRE